MGDVVTLGCKTSLPIPVDRVLQAALDANLDTVIVIGAGPNGIYHASSSSDRFELNFRVDMFKRELLEETAKENE